MSERRTITLTGRPPVRIDPEKWPIVAKVDEVTEAQSTRIDRLFVRQHADGRAIVYGESGSRAAGELLPPANYIYAALRRVAESIGAPPELANRCMAKMPAFDLD
jgi:hypothetical protein